ncbi:MAG: twin-arginine translocase subunit TatC [Comamonadaceae bacterium]|nr:twin-arginine translocase subunit TatC [Comamonadaceae bacterium]
MSPFVFLPDLVLHRPRALPEGEEVRRSLRPDDDLLLHRSGRPSAISSSIPCACRFFLQHRRRISRPVITVDQYFGLALKVLLGIGLVFEMPTLIFFLAKMGLVTAGWMVRNFKYAVLAVFVVAAVITPTPDVITQSIVAVPMLVLYGLSILIALAVGRGKEKARRAEEDLAG